MHPEAYAFVATAVQNHQARGPVYEIGSRNINGTVRGLFHDVGIYLGVDLLPGPDVDLVVDATTYQPPIAPATVVCCEVLEHTPEAEALVRQAAMVLASGGLLIMTAAGDGRMPHSAIDGGPIRDGEWYRNLSMADLERWTEAAGVEPVCLMTFNGDLYYAGRKR